MSHTTRMSLTEWKNGWDRRGTLIPTKEMVPSETLTGILYGIGNVTF